MILPTPLFAFAAAAALAPALPASVACAPARVGPNVAAQPEPWRRAVEALVDATAAPGQPWSCTGGTVDLLVHEGGATLAVTTDGSTITREISSPDDVVPLGEALLAKPLAPQPASKPPPPPKPAPPTPAAPAAPANPPPAAPRVLLSALVGPRYAGNADLLWGGLTAGALIPFGPWGAGVWARYDALAAPLDRRAARTTEIVLGAAAARGFAFGRFELRASVTPSLAILSRSTRSPGDGTRVDGRIGAEACGLYTLTPLIRLALALDGEIAPRELDTDDRPPGGRDRFISASYPAYTIGLGAGIELVIR